MERNFLDFTETELIIQSMDPGMRKRFNLLLQEQSERRVRKEEALKKVDEKEWQVQKLFCKLFCILAAIIITVFGFIVYLLPTPLNNSVDYRPGLCVFGMTLCVFSGWIIINEQKPTV